MVTLRRGEFQVNFVLISMILCINNDEFWIKNDGFQIGSEAGAAYRGEDTLVL